MGKPPTTVQITPIAMMYGFVDAAQKPHGSRRSGDKQDAVDLPPSQRVPVVVIVFVLARGSEGLLPLMCVSKLHCVSVHSDGFDSWLSLVRRSGSDSRRYFK